MEEEDKRSRDWKRNNIEGRRRRERDWGCVKEGEVKKKDAGEYMALGLGEDRHGKKKGKVCGGGRKEKKKVHERGR